MVKNIPKKVPLASVANQNKCRGSNLSRGRNPNRHMFSGAAKKAAPAPVFQRTLKGMETHTFAEKGVGAVEKFTDSLKVFIKYVRSTYIHRADLQSEIRKMAPYNMSKHVPDEPKLFVPDG